MAIIKKKSGKTELTPTTLVKKKPIVEDEESLTPKFLTKKKTEEENKENLTPTFLTKKKGTEESGYDDNVIKDLEKIEGNKSLEDYIDKNLNSGDGSNRFDLVMGGTDENPRYDYDLDLMLEIMRRDNSDSPLIMYVESESVLIKTITFKTIEYLESIYRLDYDDLRDLDNFTVIFEFAFQTNFKRFKKEAEEEIQVGMMRLISEREKFSQNKMLDYVYSDGKFYDKTRDVIVHSASKGSAVAYVYSHEDLMSDEDVKDLLIESLINNLTDLGFEF